MRRVLAVALVGLLMSGCGSDEGPPGGSVEISAEAGGTVDVGDGASLEVPPGSLSADTTITFATRSPGTELPESGSVQGKIYDFGPDGTTFDPPAVLTLPIASAAPEGKALVISVLEGDAWSDLETTSGRDTVEAKVAHFSSFGVRLRDRDVPSSDTPKAAVVEAEEAMVLEERDGYPKVEEPRGDGRTTLTFSGNDAGSAAALDLAAVVSGTYELTVSLITHGDAPYMTLDIGSVQLGIKPGMQLPPSGEWQDVYVGDVAVVDGDVLTMTVGGGAEGTPGAWISIDSFKFTPKGESSGAGGGGGTTGGDEPDATTLCSLSATLDGVVTQFNTSASAKLVDDSALSEKHLYIEGWSPKPEADGLRVLIRKDAAFDAGDYPCHSQGAGVHRAELRFNDGNNIWAAGQASSSDCEVAVSAYEGLEGKVSGTFSGMLRLTTASQGTTDRQVIAVTDGSFDCIVMPSE